MTSCNAPVALFIFNRPDVTACTFQRIREARPQRLLVVADGPRPDRPDDAARCAAARAVIVVDWPCEVKTHYSETNLGCGRRMASGITWVFEQVDRAILLEDDCLPDPSFFPYCAEMLERYADEPKVMSVSGFAARALPALAESYYFSRVGSIWGWATWRRAWSHYDYAMSGWPQAQTSPWWAYFQPYAGYIKGSLENGLPGRVNTWDYQWHFAFFSHSGLSVMPRTNLIENKGMGRDATHTTADVPWKHPVVALDFPLKHPARVGSSRPRDLRLIEALWEIEPPGWTARLRRLIRRLRARLHA